MDGGISTFRCCFLPLFPRSETTVREKSRVLTQAVVGGGLSALTLDNKASPASRERRPCVPG